jgi:hypothetical protein
VTILCLQLLLLSMLRQNGDLDMKLFVNMTSQVCLDKVERIYDGWGVLDARNRPSKRTSSLFSQQTSAHFIPSLLAALSCLS